MDRFLEMQTFNAVVDIIARGEADMAISKLSRTLARTQVISFSQPYLTLNHALILNRVKFAQFAKDRALLRRRINVALDTIRQLPEVDATRVAAMGYCFGGMCVLELARSGADVRGVISIHGLFVSGTVANEPITAKVLCLHGHDDPMVPPDQVLAFETEMTQAGVDWQIHVYGGTMHAFTNPKANNPDFGTVYREVAANRAYQSITHFLQEIF